MMKARVEGRWEKGKTAVASRQITRKAKHRKIHQNMAKRDDVRIEKDQNQETKPEEEGKLPGKESVRSIGDKKTAIEGSIRQIGRAHV